MILSCHHWCIYHYLPSLVSQKTRAHTQLIINCSESKHKNVSQISKCIFGKQALWSQSSGRDFTNNNNWNKCDIPCKSAPRWHLLYEHLEHFLNATCPRWVWQWWTLNFKMIYGELPSAFNTIYLYYHQYSHLYNQKYHLNSQLHY
jgi:hypothetical protein